MATLTGREFNGIWRAYYYPGRQHTHTYAYGFITVTG